MMSINEGEAVRRRFALIWQGCLGSSNTPVSNTLKLKQILALYCLCPPDLAALIYRRRCTVGQPEAIRLL